MKPVRFLVRGIRQLITLRGPAQPRRGPQLAEIGLIQDGAMLIEQGRLLQVGPTSRIENLAEARRAEELPCPGHVVIPAFVDAHTHLLYGPPRLDDFEHRIRSAPALPDAGGGLPATIRAVRAAPASRLRYQAARALRHAAAQGTATVEAKSGYGGDEAAEIKTLRILRNLDGQPIGVTPTYLGLHALPPEFEGRPEGFLSLVVRQILPRVAQRGLARFADADPDPCSFRPDHVRRYLTAAREAGLGIRLHVPPSADPGFVSLAAELRAASVDGLESITPPEIDLLAHTATLAVLLPGRAFHLRTPYPPARALIDAGAAVVLASNYNPATSPSCSMPFVLALACTQMRMTPAEALTAATINAAHSLGLAAETGSLEPGKWADFTVLDAADYRELPYHFGMNLVAMTVRHGEVIYSRERC